MNGLAKAERRFDRSEPAVDLRTDDQIEQDVADRTRAAKQAAATASYKYDPIAWSSVTAQREAIEATRKESQNAGNAGDGQCATPVSASGNHTKLLEAVRRILSDEFTQLKAGHRTALEQLTQ